MNAYLTKLMMYHEIHRMKREGYSISKISRTTLLNRRTVRSYLAMSEHDFDLSMEKQSERRKDLFAYEGFIKSRIEKYPDTSCAQMHDWLKEHFEDLPSISAKTVFNYVAWVRVKYSLPKLSQTRQYEMVEELPYGQQAQVDFGEYNLRTSNQKRVKVFFFTLVLSRSRYKYIWFMDKYFTSELACQAHEQAFAFIGGIPDQIVYDQDKVFITSENHGDIILTDGFKAYTRERSFTLHFCRKSDPESKGKVENVVKYTKQNFLYNRPYEDIETLNAAALGWLGRTANLLPHNGTKKQPVIEWEIEKSFFAPLSIAKIPGIGKQTAILLLKMGVETVKVLSDIPVEMMQNLLGKNGSELWRRANGSISYANADHILFKTAKEFFEKLYDRRMLIRMFQELHLAQNEPISTPNIIIRCSSPGLFSGGA